ncbi:hypothetical protein [Tenacibaculum maritimum]|uniref:hypothetical protein n=1 Tax=Tenacibaculum maritimum TaxID=107401 RepID=UPI0012E4FE2D|nr:hypothetical protein [Tenacibaculum maritimum]CAA0159180.1 conserved hypothetical protein [Tenacibaculum maritimum]
MNLILHLKKHWFNLTKDKIKTEDYREINEYWFKRLVFQHKKVYEYCTGFDWDTDTRRNDRVKHLVVSRQGIFGFKDFRTNTMKLGYPKNGDNERILNLVHLGIEIGFGKEEWGAEPNTHYFIIKHGTQIIG